MPGLLVIWVMLSARSHIESLLKARKLDVTLTSEAPLRWSLPGAVLSKIWPALVCRRSMPASPAVSGAGISRK